MNIIAFAASNSKSSINKQLVTHAMQVLQSEILPDAICDILDLNDFEMPIYSVDREEVSGIPQQAHAFLSKIQSADALVISFAEHNGNFTAAFKNIFDWVSRIDVEVFQGKDMVIMAASDGASGGASVLEIANDTAPYCGGSVKASFCVGPFFDVFDIGEGQLIDAALQQTLRESLTALAKPKQAVQQ